MDRVRTLFEHKDQTFCRKHPQNIECISPDYCVVTALKPFYVNKAKELNLIKNDDIGITLMDVTPQMLERRTEILSIDEKPAVSDISESHSLSQIQVQSPEAKVVDEYSIKQFRKDYQLRLEKEVMPILEGYENISLAIPANAVKAFLDKVNSNKESSTIKIMIKNNTINYSTV